MTKRITLVAPINSFTGYGQLSIQIVRDIERFSNTYVSIRSIQTAEVFGSRVPDDIKAKHVTAVQPEDWEIIHHPPSWACTLGKSTVYFSMSESPKLREREVQCLNQAKLVIVPSDWCAACFSASGVTTPIRTIPLGIDSELFKYRATNPVERPTKVVFGAAGRLSHGGTRKGVEDTIAAFQLAFPTEQDVELRVKIFPDCKLPETTDPRIKVLRSFLSDVEFSNWLAGCDCFVSLARSEGFGLIALQSMRMGLPVILLPWSGVTEYFHRSYGLAVDYSLEPAERYYQGTGVWAVPKLGSAVEKMRWVYNNRLAAYELGARGSAAVQGFTKEAFGRKLVEVLREVGAI